jgi:Dynamin GTPase effector domain
VVKSSPATHVCREELFEDMIRERPDVASKRDECRMALRALKDAVAALESLPADLISRINGAPDCRGASVG